MDKIIMRLVELQKVLLIKKFFNNIRVMNLVDWVLVSTTYLVNNLTILQPMLALLMAFYSLCQVLLIQDLSQETTLIFNSFRLIHRKEHQATKILTFRQVLFQKQAWIATLVWMEPWDLTVTNLKPLIKKDPIQQQMNRA